jgi:perosamine synthetase
VIRSARLNKLLAKLYARIGDYSCNFLMRGMEKQEGRKTYGSEELKLVVAALRSQNLFSIDGKLTTAFESEFASTYGVPYGVASSSGTAAIHTALGALDLNSGDEVITAPITDMGTVAPILMQNCIPVFADVDSSYNIDPVDVERKITPRTRAIIAVHLFGNPCDMDALVDISRRHGVALIEDCAQAHLTRYKGRFVGTIGDIGCFSFMQSKHMTTGEGGMTITSNKAYYERMKFFVDKGYARKGWGPRAYLFLAPNYRPTELLGALGLAQLKKVEGVVNKRRELGEYLTNLLSNIDGVKPAPVTDGAQHSYWLYPISVDKAIDINVLAKAMLEEGVWVSAGYIGRPIYLCSEALSAKKTYGQTQCPFTCKYVTKEYEYKDGLCPSAEEALRHLICFPFDESWDKARIKHAVDVLAKSLENIRSKSTLVSPAEHGEALEAQPSSVAPSGTARKLRIGIVGCGQMGRAHFEAYKANPRVELVAFSDTAFVKAQDFAKEVNAVAYSSHKEMMTQAKLDGVSVCTLPSTHREIAIDLLQGGVPVLCEKPLAISVKQAQEMVETAEAKNLLLLTAFKFRFFEEVLRAKELLEKGGIGRVLSFRIMFGGILNAAGTWYSKEEFSGGGVIMDNSTHAIDLARYLFGEVESVSAQTKTLQDIAVEDTAELTLVMKNGCFGTVDLSWNISIPSQAYLEIYGEEGTILLDNQGVTYKFKTWDKWKRITNQMSAKEAFSSQINHFVESISSNRSTIIQNDDGLKAQIVVEAAYRSAKNRTNINID